MGAQFVATQTRSALEALATERELTNAELDAFARFCDRLTAMEVSQPHPDTEHDQQFNVPVTMQSHPNNQLQRVREAYRETIMDVPHYDEVYNDSLQESLAEEFGSEIATVLTTGEHLTPPLQNQLLLKSQQARDERAQFLDSLSTETEDLRSAEQMITEIGTNLDTLNARSLETWTITDLTESREQMLAAEQQCDELAATRQTTLQNSRSPGPTPADLNLNEYLYESLPVTYPVLSDLADLTDTLHTERSRVERAISSDT
jgi:uncharacterized protein YifE (UPF0438 family)